MPRAKPSKTHPSFSIRPYSLDTETKTELINLLGYDGPVSTQQERISKAINRTEHYLGRYLAIAELDKKLPSNASLIAELNSFLGRRDFSPIAFEALYPWLQTKFRQRGFDLSVIESDTNRTTEIGAEIVSSLSGDHRGRRIDRPFKDLISQLRKIFRGFRTNELEDDSVYDMATLADALDELSGFKNDGESKSFTKAADIATSVRRYGEPEDGNQQTRHKSGSVDNLSAIEHDEYEFVVFTLDAAGIPSPKNLLDLFKDVGRAPEDRVDVLNRIARRAAKKR